MNHRFTLSMLLLLLSLAAGAEELTKIISYNTLLTFNRAQRVEEAASYLRDQKADIILFQEISRLWSLLTYMA